MKTKRYKRANRVLTFFKYNYKFVPPYRVLVDGTFCNSALVNKINLAEQMPKYLGEETYLTTTKCVLAELEKFGPILYGALVIAKQFEVIECPHQQSKSASECITHMARRAASGKTKYFMATQDDELTDKLRLIAGTPILYIKYNAILLDQPSELSKEKASANSAEMEKLKELKKQLIPEAEKKKKKRTKGANPLSCKKKKTTKAVKVAQVAEKTMNGKRKRRKKETPKEISVAVDKA